MTTNADDRSSGSNDDSVVVLAPVGRDAMVVCQTLAAARIRCITTPTLEALLACLPGGAGVVVLTEEALTEAGAATLLVKMAGQPSWSDLPIVLLLTSDEGGPRTSDRHVAELSFGRHVTVLQRPIPAVTLVTAVQASLRARRRQYEVRDLLASERAAREQAEAATRFKDEFLATVSHELRTPLSAILIWSQLLEAGRLTTDQASEAMHSITISAEAQSQLIEDLLDVSRMLVGKLRLELEPRSLGPIVRRAVDVVRPMAVAKGIRLETQFDGEHDQVLADADRMQQIFWNLLSNAVKFTPSGGLVTIQVARSDEHVIVTVTDTGEGIAPEVLPHVFERFRQADPHSGRRFGGLGIGLPIVQQLVDLHGGTIQAASTGLGQGATFTVRMPALA